MNVFIWIDDKRDLPSTSRFNKVEVAHNYDEATDLILDYWYDSYDIYIDFDHDLGEEETGYDVAQFIVECGLDSIYYRVHSMNPVGRANIEQLLEHYGYEKF